METMEQPPSPGQMLIESLYLIPGRTIRLVKINSEGQTNIPVGSAIEGILDESVKIGLPIFLDGKQKRTTPIVGVKKEGSRFFFKTETSVYELVPPSDAEVIDKGESYLKLENELEKKIHEAEAVAIPEAEFGSLSAKRSSLMARHNDSEAVKAIADIDAYVSKSIIHVSTIAEFKILMEKLGRNYYATIGTIEHENAHANKAESVGAAMNGYMIIVIKKDSGEFVYQPVALTDVSRIHNDHERIAKNISIANAPKEYGNKLSPGDEELIDRLRRELKNL